MTPPDAALAAHGSSGVLRYPDGAVGHGGGGGGGGVWAGVMGETIGGALEGTLLAIRAFQEDASAMAAAARAGEVLARVLRSGGKILVMGNGGSMCDAAHFAEELTGRYRADRRPLAALACTDAGHLSCTANDYGYEQVFARWVTALARPGDAVVLISTSGQSLNLVRATEAALEVGGVELIALVGKGGGLLATLVSGAGNGEAPSGARPGGMNREVRGGVVVAVPACVTTSDRIQEVQKVILHAWVEGIERELGLG